MGKQPLTDSAAIIKRRIDRGMGQASLARSAGVSPSCLAKIEAGTRQGSLETLKALADALGCTIADLLVEAQVA